MSTKYFATLAFLLAFNISQSLAAHIIPEYKVVVTEKKIFIVADETPVKCLSVVVKDHKGLVVAEKNMSSKSADWSIDVTHLPKGNYIVVIANEQALHFER
jgi:Domain of unknown function (DUF3244)